MTPLYKAGLRIEIVFYPHSTTTSMHYDIKKISLAAMKPQGKFRAIFKI
jgi:hypothetical protein